MSENDNILKQDSSISFNQELSLEQLFKEYYTRLVYFSFQLIKDKDAAEDIVQEAFIKYWHGREDTETGNQAIKSYLYSAVKNASLNVLRHQKVEEKYKDTLERTLPGETSILQLMIRAEVVSELHRAIQTLPAGCQQISRLGYLEGKNNQEIAEELGISVNTVKTQKQRSLQLLRLRLNPEIFGLFLGFLLG
ncbi:DNA-directed RNA polymerase sigma-70 factor [Adhaeribacter aerolatus]|uniref:DNA-directed RNA polymerase sigma-70 factor n=1 Tax=Adhaeribacter aerolatus TaxID=670289 RepID=A0A512AUF3_9BACT|nr:RNA polymerase sigma-70 factor [Adhaeribacter aerolatus]GEO03342.1 DNA-directed RNA polymerase sigma-70 factor [Adhaeribacter aerolatus]